MKNVPNLICWFRILIIPFILLFLVDNPVSLSMQTDVRVLVSGILFGIGMISDAIDGYIARKYNAVSTFGKFLDPIADKLLVLSLLLAFVELRFISSLPVIIILAREFLITGLRLGAMDKGIVIAANIWGKIKTILQSVCIGLSFVFVYIACLMTSSEVPLNSGNLTIVPSIAIWISAIFTVISAIPYFISGKDVLKD